MNKTVDIEVVNHTAEGAQELAMRYFKSDGIVVAELSGDIVGGTSGELLDALVELVACGSKGLILDVSAVREISRAGLRGIVVAGKLLQVAGGQMRICGASGQVHRALYGLSLKHLIQIENDLGNAKASLAGTQCATGLQQMAVSHAELITQPANAQPEMRGDLGPALWTREPDDAA